MSIYEFEVPDISGASVNIKQYEGKVLLFVNVASECGFTNQYEGLQQLWERYSEEGLVILGFPSNDFGGQEPGTNKEIETFCETKFGVTFPLFSKISVKGENQHPLYTYLTDRTEELGWNFNKILVDRDGEVIEYFPVKVEPLSDELVSAVEDLIDQD